MPSPNGKTPPEVAARLAEHDAALTRLAGAIEGQGRELSRLGAAIEEQGRVLMDVAAEVAAVRAELATIRRALSERLP
jgi:hypothetical protein